MIPLCEGTAIAGKYRLVRELATGGMGAVWVARHLTLDELVAVKFMSRSLPDACDARARFAREARASAKLRGPHVVEVLDHGVDGDLPYIVMELLTGEHLGDRLKRERRLPLRAAATIAAEVGRALGRAHRAGIVHRDLKPANVFLARVDDEETVKVLDFGIAKTLREHDEDVTGADVLVGSPQYMSPEQARGSKVLDHRADLWSLGAILFRAITGVPAFDGGSGVDVIVQICTGAPPVASKAAPGLPPQLDAFFLRALARDPARRFASAREMSASLSAIVDRAEADGLAVAWPAIRPAPDADLEGKTLVMDRHAFGGPVELCARLKSATSNEIDAFVERAFDAFHEGGGARIPPPRASGPGAPTPAEIDLVPPTTRCAVTRSSAPPPGGASALAAGSFGDLPASRPPSTPSLLDRLTGLRAFGTERAAVEGSVTVLIEQGFRALRRGERESARRAWQEALGLDPSNRMLALNLRRLEAMGVEAMGVASEPRVAPQGR